MSVAHVLAVGAAAVDTHTLTAGRLVGTTAALIALAGVVAGGFALTRSTSRRGSVAALAAGLVGVAAGALVVATAEGGPGTGYGVVGGFAALAAGAIAVGLGALGLVRSGPAY
jgi:hypothetical protein